MAIVDNKSASQNADAKIFPSRQGRMNIEFHSGFGNRMGARTGKRKVEADPVSLPSSEKEGHSLSRNYSIWRKVFLAAAFRYFEVEKGFRAMNLLLKPQD